MRHTLTDTTFREDDNEARIGIKHKFFIRLCNNKRKEEEKIKEEKMKRKIDQTKMKEESTREYSNYQNIVQSTCAREREDIWTRTDTLEKMTACSMECP